ncbi:hypothetical protein GGS23DRAFT_585385 [Durotheca rogersii]|uniref:uncharacterized protein n=1 Tax=Durotheca rogersii TaxID=419775 RepID=UPI00221FE000|nr:uncharacterized protein GGS23DRAFT_585385 [Durotheca rogersii]KAI5859433.1 hypothetical protein GGS23DRAFT_585385 [Durotheca rogersii]
MASEGYIDDAQNWSKGGIGVDADMLDIVEAMGGSCIEPNEVLSQAGPMAKAIFKNWDLLRVILERHEATIQKRWIKKSKPKRRATLLAAWPKMSEFHRPDIVASRKKKTGAWAYQACMWPAINLEDLSKTEPLLLMLNARGRNPPDAFTIADIDTTRFGITSRTINMPRFLNGYSMLFAGRRSPETYGQLVSLDEEPNSFDWVIKRVALLPGEGLRALEIQSRLYSFLVDVTRAILHDMTTESLTDPALAVQPEPPIVSANSNSSNTTSLSVTALESSYRLPARLDLSRLKLAVEAKLSEAEDHLWALREDPAYFAMNILDWKEHRQEMLADLRGNPHPIHRSGSGIFWDRVIRSATFTALQMIEYWGILLEKITCVAELQARKYPNGSVRFEDNLPLDFAMAFYQLHNHLVEFRKVPIKMIVEGWVASPPMRPYWRRKPPPNTTTPLITTVYIGNTELSSPEGEMMSVISTLNDDHQLFLVGLPSLMDEIERLMKGDSAASQLVSGWVAEKISHLSVISESLRQLELFQPWAATFEAAMVEHEDEIKRDYEKTLKRLRALYTFESVPSTMCLGIPTDGRFKYPAEKRRTKETVDVMRSAERALDQFWLKTRHDLEAAGAMTPRLRRIFSQRVQRTPEWTAPTEVVRRAVASSAAASSGDLAAPFGGLDLKDKPRDISVAEPKDILAAQPKVKLKTRGAPRSTPTDTTDTPGVDVPIPPNREPLFEVDKRAHKVFGSLFFAPSISSQPGEVSWSEFLYAMGSIGFAMEKLHGSAWRFVRETGDVGRSILFHEPHPRSKLSLVQARRIGRRLNKTYGWEWDLFTLR